MEYVQFTINTQNRQKFKVFKSNFFSEPEVLSKYNSCHEHQHNFDKRGKSLFVIVPTAPTDNYEKFTERVREYNTKEPFNFPVPKIFQSYNIQKVSLFCRSMFAIS